MRHHPEFPRVSRGLTWPPSIRWRQVQRQPAAAAVAVVDVQDNMPSIITASSCLSFSFALLSHSASFRRDVGLHRPHLHREPSRPLSWLLARLCAFLWRYACWIRRQPGSTTHHYLHTFGSCPLPSLFSLSHSSCLALSSSTRSPCAYSSFSLSSRASGAPLPSSRSFLSLSPSLNLFSLSPLLLPLSFLFFSTFSLSALLSWLGPLQLYLQLVPFLATVLPLLPVGIQSGCSSCFSSCLSSSSPLAFPAPL